MQHYIDVIAGILIIRFSVFKPLICAYFISSMAKKTKQEPNKWAIFPLTGI